MITLDTGAIFAIANAADGHHASCLTELEADSGPHLIPTACLAEIIWLMETRLPSFVQDAFVEDLKRGTYRLDWNDRDLPRIQELARRYHDLPLGFVDAAVIACAERHSGRVLTTDRRHFPVVARGEKTITVLPEQ